MRPLLLAALAAASLLLSACGSSPASAGDPNPAAPAVYDARNTVSSATRSADGSGPR